MNPEFNTDYNLDFREFLSKFDFANGILIDPPYSPHQIKQCYDGWGLKLSQEDSRGFYQHVWDHIIRIQPDFVIQFGWHTNGRKGYYGIHEILINTHGGNHYDTLVSVHTRMNEQLGDDFV